MRLPLKPLKLARYEPGELPDPKDWVDCLVIVNDRTNASAAHICLSSGTSWDRVAMAGDVVNPVTQTYDLTPIVRQAVQDLLPAVKVQPPAVNMIAARNDNVDRIDAQVAALTAALHEMQDRMEYVERNALARVDLVESA